MARPTENKCAYFSHDSGMRNHPKVKALRKKFPDNGYSVWSMLLELLCGADGNVFKYSPMQFEIMSGDFDVDSGRIKEIIDYCLTMEMLFNRDGYINSDSLDERLAPVYAKRRRQKELSAEQKREKGKFTGVSVTETPQATVVPDTEKPQSKVNKSKVKESKKDIVTNLESAGQPPLLKPLTDYDLCVEFWLKVFRPGYTFRGVHGKALKGIISQIKELMRNTPPKENVEPLTVPQMFEAICRRLPDWYKTQDLQIINSKFNTIITEIKNLNQNGKSGTAPKSAYHNA